MRAVLLVLLVVATTACGAYRFPGESSVGTGIVSGHVRDVPCGPAESATQPCAVAPVGGAEIDFSGNGATVSSRTDSQGAYSVELAEGTWKVSLKTYLRVINGPSTVTVTANAHVVADFVVASGIVAPGAGAN
jgi:hypothetical protein